MPDNEKELYNLLDACRRGDRNSQTRLYKEYYAYAMGICLRYSRTREEAIEILNDGFVKIFTKLNKYTKGLPFKGWLRKVMINAAIDYFRRHEKHYHSVDISYARYEEGSESVLDQISEKEILQAIQQLPPSYRLVFNLYAIDGFKHEEIARQLNISVGTSKSNLAVARNKLQKSLIVQRAITQKQQGNG